MSARWPAMMRRKTAAEYMDMSEAAFEREVASGRLPAAVPLGGRDHWRRDALDKALDFLTGESAIPHYRRKLQERAGRAA